MVQSDSPEGARHRILVERRVIILEFTGTLTLKILIAAAEQMYRDPEYDPEFNAIIDLTNCEIKMNFMEVAQYVWFLRSHPRLRGKAVFVTTSQMGFGMSRMFIGAASDFMPGVHFEDTVEDAFAWLDENA